MTTTGKSEISEKSSGVTKGTAASNKEMASVGTTKQVSLTKTVDEFYNDRIAAECHVA